MFIEIGISARHVHLSREDVDVLFGEGYQLTKLKDLKQTGQYAAVEQVEVVGPKGSFRTVRILGPERKRSQVELSASDCIKLGVQPVVRDSGKHEGTPGAVLIGPNGRVELQAGVLVAARHVHLCPQTAEREGIRDGELLCATVEGERETMFGKVLARVDETYVDEFHLDTDEANACSAKSGQLAEIVKCR